MKLQVIWQIIRSDHFAFIKLMKNDGMTGYVDLHITPGFTKSQQERVVSLGQDILCEQMTLDILETNVVNEANQILNS